MTSKAEEARSQKAKKPPMELVLKYFPHALRSIARVAKFGDQKHAAPWGEEHPMDEDYYLGAQMRHILAHLEGNPIDPDSGLPHLAHAAFNSLAMLTVTKRSENANSI